jgi:hypothetical protein
MQSFFDSFVEETVLPIQTIDKYFTVQTNSGQGNCLFYSISQCIYGNTSNHKKIRKLVYDFYQIFDENATYPDNSIESKIQLQLLLETNENEKNKHQNIICANNIWGKLVDLYVISLLFDVNILVFNKFDKFNYTIHPIKVCGFVHSLKEHTIYLRYDSIVREQEHYEALLFSINNNDNKCISSSFVNLLNSNDNILLHSNHSNNKKSYAQIVHDSKIHSYFECIDDSLNSSNCIESSTQNNIKKIIKTPEQFEWKKDDDCKPVENQYIIVCNKKSKSNNKKIKIKTK